MPVSALTLALVAVACLIGSVAASRLALTWLTERGILDRPNDRSSHRAPVARGGGIGFVAVILVVFTATSGSTIAVPILVLAGALLVAAISFADDIRPLRFPLRLGVQAVAVAMALATLPDGAAVVSSDLPAWLDRTLAGLGWLWFINLFNFMDGIDGIAAGEAVVIAGGSFLLAVGVTAYEAFAMPAIAIAAAAGGFLLLNWHPARLFMGDVGSVTLGFLLGWLLVEMAVAGELAAALILPMFFLADATSTLLVRFVRRRPLAKAHRDHAYQAAVDRGHGQRLVSGLVIALGVVLIGLALVADEAPMIAVLAALAITSAMILWMRFGGQPRNER